MAVVNINAALNRGNIMTNRDYWEYSKANSLGERKQLDRVSLTESEAIDIVNRGGMLETREGFLLTSPMMVEDYIYAH